MITKHQLLDLMHKYGFRPNKRLGQSFLVDKNIAEKIIGSLPISDVVVEIGAGLGQLTEGLTAKTKVLYAVEKDRRLIPALKEIKGAEIICNDILSVDLKKIYKKHKKKFTVVGNLPYYITTPIIAHLLDSHKIIDSIYITTQKELAKRLVAKPGNKEYGSITCFVGYYTEPKILFTIKKNSFFPAPDVDSSLLHLRVLDKPSVRVKDEKLLFNIIRAAFNQRRKTLLNALANSKKLNLPKSLLSEVLYKSGIDPLRRGETLSLAEFAQIANAL